MLAGHNNNNNVDNYEPNRMAKHSMANVQMLVWTSLRTRAFSSPEASIPSMRNIATGRIFSFSRGWDDE